MKTKVIKKIGGGLLVASPFVAIYMDSAVKFGFIEALVPIAITAITVLVIAVGVELLNS